MRHHVRVVDNEQEAEEREQRQYALLRERVARFRRDDLSIGLAIGDLSGLVNALDRAPEGWKDRFATEINTLELAYAVALDGQWPLPTAASDTAIREALDAMDTLIDEQSPRT